MGSSFSICGWKPFSKKPSTQAVEIPLSNLQQRIPLSTLQDQELVPPALQEPVQEPPPIQTTISPPTAITHPKDEGPPAVSSPEAVSILPTVPRPQQTYAPPPPQIEDPQRSADPLEAVDPKEIEDIREKFRQFRVLLMGKANSGKTTIIRKMCDSDEDPTVYDENGKECPASVLEQPKAMRGEHDIRHQIIHKNNPNFIFHDSRGFEAGSTKEVEQVKEFIKDKLAKTKLSDRLHAIWFCIPVDSTRVASKAELNFFEENTGDIPVIVVFTKWDGGVIRAFNKLEYTEGVSITQAKKEAPELARRILEEEFVPIFNKTTYPPTSYAVLGYMNKSETKCGELVEKTAAALNDNVLKKLFVSVQTHNLELCIKGGINEAVSEYIFSSSNSSPTHEKVLRMVLSWFPHIYWTHDYSSEERGFLRGFLFGFEFREFEFREFEEGELFGERGEERQQIVESFQPVLSGSEQAFLYPRLQHLHNAASAAIVAIRSFDVKKRTEDTVDAVKTSIEEYLQSPQYHVVKEAVNAKFVSYADYPDTNQAQPTEQIVKKISEELQKICLDNLLISSN